MAPEVTSSMATPNRSLDLQPVDTDVAESSETPTLTFLALPTELVILAVSFCTTLALFALAQTCIRLNTIALNVFFAQNNIKEFENWLWYRVAPRGTLDAIRLALDVTRVSHIRWKFRPGWQTDEDRLGEEDNRSGSESGHELIARVLGIGPGTAGMGPLTCAFDEIANLRAVIARHPEVRLVSLYFGQLDSLSMLSQKKRMKQVDRTLWRNEVAALLDDVLDNGCEVLELQGGWLIERLYKSSLRTRFSSMKITSLVRPLFSNSTKNSHDPLSRTRTRIKPLKLKELHIHSEMLLMPPFYDWTLSLLTSPACASVLTHLSFNLFLKGNEKWIMPTPLLVSLNLPNLVEFEMTIYSHVLFPRYGDRVGRAKFEDVAMFLRRHNGSLRRVQLSGVGLPAGKIASQSTSGSGYFFESQKAIFPHLESFTAHPLYILWLLDVSGVSSSPATLTNPSAHTHKTNARKGNTRPSTDPSILRCLKSIGLTSQYGYLIQPFFDYGLFDDALSAVAGFCRWRDEQDAKLRAVKNTNEEKELEKDGERTIELALQFTYQPGVGEWFANHLAASSPSLAGQAQRPTSILTQLTCISTLTISCARLIELPYTTIVHLPNWLALIFGGSSPSIGSTSISRRVRFTDQREETDLLLFAGNLVTQVAEKCIRLRYLELRGEVFDLDGIRRNTSGGRQSM